MNIWNKILLGFIFVAAIAEAFLGAKTLNIHKTWRESYNTQLSEGERLEGEIDTTKNTRSKDEIIGEMGTFQLALISDRMSIARGRVFPHCEPLSERQDTESIQVRVRTTRPDRHGLETNELLYVFEGGTFVEPAVTVDPLAETGSFAPIDPVTDPVDSSVEPVAPPADEPPGLYLGTFKIVETNDADEVVLAPAYALLPEEIQAIADSVASDRCWILHDTIPRDDPAIFDDMTDDEIRTLLQGDPEYAEEVVRDREKRALRDYDFLIAECHRIRATQRVRREQLESAIATIQADIVLCDEQKAHRQEQKLEYAAEIKRLNDELTLIETHRDSLQDRIDALTLLIEEKLVSNASHAAELARRQEEAITAADRETAPLSSTP
jgi:hypothetical protein